MDFDQLKNTWKEFDRRLDRLENESRQAAIRVARGKVRSGQQKLARSFRINSAIALVGSIITVFCAGTLDLSVWLTCLMVLYLLAMGLASLLFSMKVANHDFMGEPTVKAIEYALRLRRQRLTLVATGAVCGLAVITTFFCQLANAGITPAIWGGATGFVVGLAAGYMKFRRQSQLLRQLTAELKQMQE